MKSAVLVIDVQRGLFDPVPRPFEANEVVERINTITQNARNYLPLPLRELLAERTK